MRWARRPTIMSYIVDCYAGLDTLPGTVRKRRVFLWEEGTVIKMGNTEAFLTHLVTRFNITLTPGATGDIHSLLRELGERVLPSCGWKRTRGTPTKEFRAPEPDSWVVGRVEATT